MPEFRGRRVRNGTVLKKRGLAKWTSVHLYGTSVDDEGVIEICRSCPQLRELHIVSTLISDASMSAMCEVPCLESLLLDDVPNVTDEGIGRVPQLAATLQELYLTGTALTDSGMEAVVQCQDLWSLAVRRTRLTDNGLRGIGALSKLASLDVSETRVTGAGFVHIPNNCPLDVFADGCLVGDAEIAAFARGHSGIRTLSLNRTSIGDRAVKSLADVQELSDLRFEETAVSDVGVLSLIGHSHLAYVYCGGSRVSDEACAELRIGGSRKVTVYDQVQCDD